MTFAIHTTIVASYSFPVSWSHSFSLSSSEAVVGDAVAPLACPLDWSDDLTTAVAPQDAAASAANLATFLARYSPRGVALGAPRGPILSRATRPAGAISSVPRRPRQGNDR